MIDCFALLRGTWSFAFTMAFTCPGRSSQANLVANEVRMAKKSCHNLGNLGNVGLSLGAWKLTDYVKLVNESVGSSAAAPDFWTAR
jgi:hypothetical protein